jgi:hypothetical protein
LNKPFEQESMQGFKPVRRGSPTLGRFDSGAAPFARAHEANLELSA